MLRNGIISLVADEDDKNLKKVFKKKCRTSAVSTDSGIFTITGLLFIAQIFIDSLCGSFSCTHGKNYSCSSGYGITTGKYTGF